MPVMNDEYMLREEAAAYEDRGDELPGGEPTGEEAKPTGEEAKPTGEEAKPTGEEAKPTGEEAKPTGEEAKPTGEEAKPTGEEAKPTGEEAKPAEGEGEGEETKQQPGPGWVPRHRYNAQARRARELEQRIQQLEQGGQPAGEQSTGEQPAAKPAEAQVTGSESVQQQLTEVNSKITQAIRDGSAEGLDDLYKQQLDLQAQYAREVAQEAAQTTTRSANDETAYDRRITEVEQEYPQLNPDMTDSYDDALAARVETLRDAYVTQGYTMTDAIDEALTVLEPLLTPAQKAAADAAPKSDERTQEALRRNAEAAGQQPAPADGGAASDQHGHKANGPDVANMTEEEFDALPDETKKRARGDDF